MQKLESEKFNFASIPVYDIEEIDWDLITNVDVTQDGSGGTVFVQTMFGSLVLKSSLDPAVEYFTYLLFKKLNLKVPKTRVIEYCDPEYDRIVKSIDRLTSSNYTLHKRVHERLSRAPYLMIMEYVAGRTLGELGQDMAQELLDSKTKGGQVSLIELGRILAIDTIMNMLDRYPLIWDNEGNSDNLIYAFQTSWDTKVDELKKGKVGLPYVGNFAIDNRPFLFSSKNPLAQKNYQNYLQKVKVIVQKVVELITNVKDEGSDPSQLKNKVEAFQKLTQFIYTYTAHSLTGADHFFLAIGLIIGYQDFINLDFQEIQLIYNKVISFPKINYGETWTENIKSLNLEMLEDMKRLITEVFSHSSASLNWVKQYLSDEASVLQFPVINQMKKINQMESEELLTNFGVTKNDIRKQKEKFKGSNIELKKVEDQMAKELEEREEMNRIAREALKEKLKKKVQVVALNAFLNLCISFLQYRNQMQQIPQSPFYVHLEYPYNRPGPLKDSDPKKKPVIKREFPYGCPSVPNLGEIDWKDIRCCVVPGENPTGVILLHTSDGNFVINGSAEPAVEYFGNLVFEQLKIEVPESKLIQHTNPQFKHILISLDKASYFDHDIKHKIRTRMDRPFFLIQEYIPGVHIDDLGAARARECYRPDYPEGRDRLIMMGVILSADVFLNNMKRYPLIWTDPGNTENIIIKCETTHTTKNEELFDTSNLNLKMKKLYAIDNKPWFLSKETKDEEKSYDEYLKKLDNLLQAIFDNLQNVKEGRFNAFDNKTFRFEYSAVLSSFIYNQTEVDIQTLGELQILLGLCLGFANIASMGMGIIENLQRQTEKAIETDWKGLWHQNCQKISLNILQDEMDIIQKHVSENGEIIGWANVITLNNYLLKFPKTQGMGDGESSILSYEDEQHNRVTPGNESDEPQNYDEWLERKLNEHFGIDGAVLQQQKNINKNSNNNSAAGSKNKLPGSVQDVQNVAQQPQQIQKPGQLGQKNNQQNPQGTTNQTLPNSSQVAQNNQNLANSGMQNSQKPLQNNSQIPQNNNAAGQQSSTKGTNQTSNKDQTQNNQKSPTVPNNTGKAPQNVNTSQASVGGSQVINNNSGIQKSIPTSPIPGANNSQLTQQAAGKSGQGSVQSIPKNTELGKPQGKSPITSQKDLKNK